MKIRFARRKIYRLQGVVRHGGSRLRETPRLSTARILSVCIPTLSIIASALVVGHSGGLQEPGTSLSAEHKNRQKTSQATEPQDTPPPSPTVSASGTIVASAPRTSTSAASKPYWTTLPLYRDPASEPTVYAQGNPAADGVSLLKRQGEVPTAIWFGDWNVDVQADANKYVTTAAQAKAVPVLALYNIPGRDCGNYSSGGAASESAYINWVRTVSAGIGNKLAVIILEPDALASLDCLSSADQQSRYNMLSQAVTILKTNPNAAVYIDAGNPGWQSAGTTAERLRAANIAQADGFSLNVSNYMSTSRNQAYGDQVSKLVSNKHYVIDTSRNGISDLSPDAWCNSTGAALGALPTMSTGNALNDALLWVKLPWESDGTCNGGPEAGMVFWPFAIQLAKNAGW